LSDTPTIRWASKADAFESLARRMMAMENTGNLSYLAFSIISGRIIPLLFVPIMMDLYPRSQTLFLVHFTTIISRPISIPPQSLLRVLAATIWLIVFFFFFFFLYSCIFCNREHPCFLVELSYLPCRGEQPGYPVVPRISFRICMVVHFVFFFFRKRQLCSFHPIFLFLCSPP